MPHAGDGIGGHEHVDSQRLRERRFHSAAMGRSERRVIFAGTFNCLPAFQCYRDTTRAVLGFVSDHRFGNQRCRRQVEVEMQRIRLHFQFRGVVSDGPLLVLRRPAHNALRLLDPLDAAETADREGGSIDTLRGTAERPGHSANRALAPPTLLS